MSITESKALTEFHIQSVGSSVRSAGTLFIRINLYIPSSRFVAKKGVTERLRNLLAINLNRQQGCRMVVP